MQLKSTICFTILCVMVGWGQSLWAQQSFTSSRLFTSQENTLLQQNQLFQLYALIGLHQADEYPIDEYRQNFYTFLDELEIEQIPQTYDKANKLYNALQENYLLNYAENTLFAEIFTAQQFNSVTGTALYALALSYLNIPYQIKTNPQQVFLVAYPNQTEVIFDCTADHTEATGFVYRKTESYKQFLLKQELISEEEAQDEHFRDLHFLNDTILNIQQLAAIPYYHHFVKHLEKDELDYALYELEKAVYLYEAPYMLQWLKLCIQAVLLDEDNKHDVSTYCNYLIKHKQYNWDTDDIQKKVAAMAAERAQLFMSLSNSDSLIKQYNLCLKSEVNDESLAQEINRKIHLLVAQSYYLDQKYDQSLDYLYYAYEAGDSQQQSYIKNCLNQKFKKIENPASGLDTLYKYESIFPFVQNDRDLKAYKAYYLMKNVYGYFKIEDVEQGLSYLTAFRNAFQPADEALYRKQPIASGFAAAVFFYATNQQYEIAKQLVNEALQYVPDDSVLLSLQQKLVK